MIYYSEVPLRSWQPNLIMLDLEDNLGHIYVTRNTYDQAVLLSDRFNHDSELVFKKLGCPETQSDAVSYMIAVLPKPINILVPFYHLIDDSVILNVDNTKQMVGVLSYMSMQLDFNMMLKVPFEVRANLVFTKSILLDYQGHFEDFSFKIIDDESHIVNRGGGKNIPRSQKEDFDLNEDEEEEDNFDLDSFMKDIGWDEVEIPKIMIEEKPKKIEVVEEVSSLDSYNESASYNYIINKYVEEVS